MDGSHNPPKAVAVGKPMLSARNVRERGIHLDEYRFISDEAFELEDARTQIQAGDVLLTIVGAIGRTAVVPADYPAFALQRSVAVLRPTVIRPRTLAYALETPRVQKYLTDNARGTAQKGIYLGTLATVELDLPPAPEQQRIADKLDTVLARVDACRDRLARVAPLLKRFRQSVLAAATSGQLTGDWRASLGQSAGWQEVLLGDIADVQGGITKDAKKQSQADEEVPYLRVANVQRGLLDLTEMKTIRIPTSRLPALLLRPGDVLFNEGGDLDKLGRGWIWEGQIERCSFQNHVFRARLYDPSNEPKYISWWGNSRGLTYFLGAGKQTTNLASINRSLLCALPVSLPPAAEQAEIVRRVESLFAYADRLEARLAKARSAVGRLTPALLAKAFRGELVPQDPSDEPAAELLRQIAEENRQTDPAKARRRRQTA